MALDNLAAAVALGASGQRHRLPRIAFVFAAFGALAPLAGSLAGTGLAERLADWAALIGAAVLGLLGIWMITAAFRSEELAGSAARATRGSRLLLIAAGLSADNLLVGFGLGLHGVQPFHLAAASGAFVLAATVLGISVGHAASRRWRRWPPVAAGVLLIGLATAAGLGWL